MPVVDTTTIDEADDEETEIATRGNEIKQNLTDGVPTETVSNKDWKINEFVTNDLTINTEINA